MFKTEGQVLLCLPPHWGRVFGHDKKCLVSNDIHCKEYDSKEYLLDPLFRCISDKKHIVISLASAWQVFMALFRAVKHRRVSDTYFPKHILVILRHACLGVIWQSQVALVQVSHFPSQAQTSQCIYNK